MKTGEQIIEDYFRARGACKQGDYWYFDGYEWFEFPAIDSHFDLFREHVIEAMRQKGARPNIVTRSDGKEVFQWTNIVPIRLGVVIEDDCWTLAAIEAATEVLNAER